MFHFLLYRIFNQSSKAIVSVRRAFLTYTCELYTSVRKCLQVFVKKWTRMLKMTRLLSILAMWVIVVKTKNKKLSIFLTNMLGTDWSHFSIYFSQSSLQSFHIIAHCDICSITRCFEFFCLWHQSSCTFYKHSDAVVMCMFCVLWLTNLLLLAPPTVFCIVNAIRQEWTTACDFKVRSQILVYMLLLESLSFT